jgi:membrane associated rhomboid family serine protease
MRFDTFVAQLVLAENASCRLLNFSDDFAVMQENKASGALVFVADAQDQEPPLLVAKIDHALQMTSHGTVWVLIVNGDAKTKSMLQQIQPKLMVRLRVAVAQLSADGKVWIGPHAPVMSLLVRSLKKDLPVIEADDADLLKDRLMASIQQNRKDLQELKAFSESFQARRPLFSYGLVGLCVAIFILEHIFGGADFIPTLFRMGANGPAVLQDGQWYRLGASMLLHGGGLHILFNMVVLVLLGGCIERLFGAARMLLLFGIAGLGGSLLSALFSQATSVGASGGLWGFLGACGVLAYWPSAKVPKMMVSQLRRSATLNLVVNIANSFHPQVDFWAHLGGGLAGAFLVVIGVIRWQHVFIDLPEHKDKTQQGFFSFLAYSIMALVIGCSAWAIWQGKAWQITEKPVLVKKSLYDSKVRIGIPHVIAEQTPQKSLVGTGETYVYGKMPRDPIVLEVMASSLSEQERQLDERQFRAAIIADLKNKKIDQFSEFELDGIMTIYYQMRLLGGLEQDGYIQLKKGWLVLLKSAIVPNSRLGSKIYKNLAKKVLASLEVE